MAVVRPFVRLEQAHAQQQLQWDVALDGMQNASVMFDRAQLLLHGLQTIRLD